MKRILLIVLVLVLSVNLGSVCFAALGDGSANIVDEDNVGAAAYDEQGNIIEVFDEDLAEANAQQQAVIEEEVPKASALPQTGGIPAEAFYAVGALLIVSAIIISKKKVKPASKG